MKTVTTDLDTADLNYIIFMINRYKQLSPVGFNQKEKQNQEYIINNLYKLQKQL